MFHQTIAQELSLSAQQVATVLRLFSEGSTLPFIARYRKEATGSLDEMQLALIRDRHQQLQELEKRREAILSSIEEQGKLSAELRQKILACELMSALEDLYLPYRPKRKTRATMAIAKGLEPLAQALFQQDSRVEEKARQFLSDEVSSAEEALAGASDIVAEWAAEDALLRAKMRKLFLHKAVVSSKLQKNKSDDGAKYSSYIDSTELLSKAPSHRILAMFRGENEEVLKLRIEPDEEEAIALMERNFQCRTALLSSALKDSYKRLLQGQMETEMRAHYKAKADEEAIRIFADNLRQLLLASPLGKKRVLALDPGFRTGCKLVCLNELGQFLHNETIYPHPPQGQWAAAQQCVLRLVKDYRIEAIAIGNGTAGRETEALVRSLTLPSSVLMVMVSESGASVYSASEVARAEFPDQDVTVRGAISIGRRLMDPLAELVKIDPKSIGVGQYQHDVDPKRLKSALDDTVVSCVNRVGVELNTASKELLSHVSGLGDSLAQNIVQYRQEQGAFRSRSELKKVARFGPKAYEQAAGFLRISDAANPLDRSAVHPERYALVEKMAKDLQTSVEQLLKEADLRQKIVLKDYVSDSVGLPTLRDILQELEKPGRDPREHFEAFAFDPNIREITDLRPGMELQGIVTNIAAFGAFVDIGVHQDGLVHKSMMANRFVKDPNEVVKLQQIVRVKVVDVDVKRKRIQLSMR